MVGALRAQQASGAWVKSLTGTLTLKRASAPMHMLRINDPVQPGDELITGENSEAVIQTASGATVHIFPDSHVVLSEPSPDLHQFLHLFLGSIKVHVEKLSGRPNPHKLTTPTAVIAVRGTTFSVFVDDTDSTLVAVDEGMVSVANVRSPSQEVMLQRGQRTWVHPGQPPTLAKRFRGPSENADMASQNMGHDRGMGSGSMGAGMGQSGGASHGMSGMAGHGPGH